MKLRGLAVIGFLVATLSASGSALALPPEDSGPYLGLGVGFGFDDFSNTGPIDPDTAYGFDAWGGYKFNKWVAAELQLEYLNGFEDDSFDVWGQGVTFGANVKLFPLASFLGRQIQPFLKLGPGFTWVDFDFGPFSDDDLDFSARFGGGIDFYVTEHVALQLSSSYVLTTGTVSDFDYTSLVVGFQYRF